MQRHTLIDFFHDLARLQGEFLVFDDGYRKRSHSYAEVGRAARGFAARLSAAGLRKGDKVLFWGENRPEWIACYWGCLLNGIIVVPVDYRASPEFAARVRGLVDARVVLTGDEVAHHNPFEGGATGGANGVAVWPFADFDWHGDGPLPAVDISRDDLIQIIFTSSAWCN